MPGRRTTKVVDIAGDQRHSRGRTSPVLWPFGFEASGNEKEWWKWMTLMRLC